MKICKKLILTLVLALVAGVGAQEAAAADRPAEPVTIEVSEQTVAIELKDGSTLIGKVVTAEPDSIGVVTSGGLELDVPRASIVSVKPARGEDVEGMFRRSDPNYSRLMFSPTGRPLRKGHGYFSDFYVVIPSVAYGITDNVSIAAGMSVIPAVGLSEQVFYVAPRIGAQVSENLAVSGGLLYATAGSEADEVAAGIAFGVATVGKPDKSFSAGLGFGYTRDGADVDFESTPILMLGGNLRLSNHLALVSENWLILGEDFDLSNQPFGAAVRFFGDRLSADVGVLVIGEVLDEGFPIPWLSFAYHFGNR